jgi:hypothetical protein
VASALAQQRVIEKRHNGASRGQSVQHAAERDAPQGFSVQALTLEQTIGGRPIAELLPGRTK